MASEVCSCVLDFLAVHKFIFNVRLGGQSIANNASYPKARLPEILSN